MSWALSHRESESLAVEAHDALRRGDTRTARVCFARAAKAEVEALDALGPDKPRTLGITAISAAALWCKSGEINQAETLAHRASIMEGMPGFAQDELCHLLRTLWDAQTRSLVDGSPAPDPPASHIATYTRPPGLDEAVISSTASLPAAIAIHLRERIGAADDGRLSLTDEVPGNSEIGILLTRDEYALLTGEALLARNPDRLSDALARMSKGNTITFADIFMGKG